MKGMGRRPSSLLAVLWKCRSKGKPCAVQGIFTPPRESTSPPCDCRVFPRDSERNSDFWSKCFTLTLSLPNKKHHRPRAHDLLTDVSVQHVPATCSAFSAALVCKLRWRGSWRTTPLAAADKTVPPWSLQVGNVDKNVDHEAMTQMAKAVLQEEYRDPDGSVCPSAPHLAPALQLGINQQPQRERSGKTTHPFLLIVLKPTEMSGGNATLHYSQQSN